METKFSVEGKMSFISKVELKYQLQKMGINIIEGNYVRKSEIEKRIKADTKKEYGQFDLEWEEKLSGTPKMILMESFPINEKPSGKSLGQIEWASSHLSLIVDGITIKKLPIKQIGEVWRGVQHLQNILWDKLEKDGIKIKVFPMNDKGATRFIEKISDEFPEN